MASASASTRPSGGGALASQRWRRLIPLAFITYSFAYLDRSNYSIGVAGGPKDDLGIGPQASALLGALFLAGYFLFQIPAAHYAENKSVSRLMVNSAGAVGGFVGAYVVGWLQGGIGNGAAYTFMAVALFLAAGLMFAVNTRGRKGVDLAESPRSSQRQAAS